MVNAVTAVPAADSAAAVAHFESEFEFETDCWDVHEALKSADPGFVLFDCRSHAMFAAGHIPGAISMPHAKIIGSAVGRWPEDTLFVTYCSGPHCNGAARGAIRLAKLGRKVKILVGGITGWLDEDFELVRDAEAA